MSYTSQSLDEDLHTTTKTQHQMQSRFFLNVVIGKSAAILQLLSCENQSLLIWRNSLFVLNLCLHVFDAVAGLNVEGDSLT